MYKIVLNSMQCHKSEQPFYMFETELYWVEVKNVFDHYEIEINISVR